MLPRIIITPGKLYCGSPGYIASRKVMGRELNIAEFLYESDAVLFACAYNMITQLDYDTKELAMKMIEIIAKQHTSKL